MWLCEISHFKSSLVVSLYEKNHLCCCNDAVPWLNEVKSEIFETQQYYRATVSVWFQKFQTTKVVHQLVVLIAFCPLHYASYFHYSFASFFSQYKLEVLTKICSCRACHTQTHSFEWVWLSRCSSKGAVSSVG